MTLVNFNLFPPQITLITLSIAILFCKPFCHLFSKANQNKISPLFASLFKQAAQPATWVLLSFACEYSLSWFWTHYPPVPRLSFLPHIINSGLGIIRAGLGLWLFLGIGEGIYQWFRQVGEEPGRHPFISAMSPRLRFSIKFIIIALTLPTLLPSFLYTTESTYVLEKLSAIMVIWSLAWFLIQLTGGLENYTLKRYNAAIIDDFKARRVYTQARVFRKIAMVAIAILATAISLTVFESVRQLGTSLLASAGIATVVAGLAAQRTLGNLFAGLQIAITQPIKINDALIIENEFGTVEEITLSYVVLRLWDLRRMIIPINYFLEKPFQNWTRTSTSLLAPAFLYFDYSLPVEAVRQELMRILESSKKWDGVVAALQVTDATEHTIQLRALGSATNAPSAFDLKCEIRERLVAFVAKNYPHCLSKTRQENYTGSTQSPKVTSSDKVLA